MDDLEGRKFVVARGDTGDEEERGVSTVDDLVTCGRAKERATSVNASVMRSRVTGSLNLPFPASERHLVSAEGMARHLVPTPCLNLSATISSLLLEHLPA